MESNTTVMLQMFKQFEIQQSRGFYGFPAKPAIVMSRER
jgi:hypothetical protein